MRLYEIWKLTMATWGLPTRRITFNQLMRQHRLPQRHYHTRLHLEECFRLWHRNRVEMENPALVALALFWHDAVYLPGQKGNEERSALLFQEYFLYAEHLQDSEVLSRQVVDAVMGLILATKHHTPDDESARWVCDIDMAILAAEPARYDTYAQQIRQEHELVPDDIFNKHRIGFLTSILERPEIFHTQTLRQSLEVRAQKNLARELQQLMDKTPIT